MYQNSDALCLFKALLLSFFPNFPGPTFIQCPTAKWYYKIFSEIARFFSNFDPRVPLPLGWTSVDFKKKTVCTDTLFETENERQKKLSRFQYLSPPGLLGTSLMSKQET